MSFVRSRLLISVAVLCLIGACFPVFSISSRSQAQTQTAAQQPLTEEQMREFLLKANVVSSKQTSKGVTNPWRLTLSDGQLTHDGGFQSINQSKMTETFANGTTELMFRDTYHFNIAAYELAKLLGLEPMLPVTVERKWGGNTGSLTWWLSTKMDQGEMLKKKILPPDLDAWNKQMSRVQVFSQLIYDTDRNMTNMLVGENWEIYMIDFSRAFRLHKTLQDPKMLVRCDRQLLAKLRQLDPAEAERVTKPHLNKMELDALMARRDKIIAFFDQLIAQKGEDQVLY
jgi:hypothetical protein